MCGPNNIFIHIYKRERESFVTSMGVGGVAGEEVTGPLNKHLGENHQIFNLI